jgi:hypothetical protein
MEIMVGRWFQSDMSDKELLDYLNNTEEGQKILSGLAFPYSYTETKLY